MDPNRPPTPIQFPLDLLGPALGLLHFGRVTLRREFQHCWTWLALPIGAALSFAAVANLDLFADDSTPSPSGPLLLAVGALVLGYGATWIVSALRTQRALGNGRTPTKPQAIGSRVGIVLVVLSLQVLWIALFPLSFANQGSVSAAAPTGVGLAFAVGLLMIVVAEPRSEMRTGPPRLVIVASAILGLIAIPWMLTRRGPSRWIGGAVAMTSVASLVAGLLMPAPAGWVELLVPRLLFYVGLVTYGFLVLAVVYADVGVAQATPTRYPAGSVP